jgi:hypothetical protein
VQRADSSVSDEHTYCKVEAAVDEKRGDTMTLASFDVVKAVRATAAEGTCDLRRSSALKSSSGQLTWTMGDMSADLKPVTRTGSRPVPAQFLGTWQSEVQGAPRNWCRPPRTPCR